MSCSVCLVSRNAYVHENRLRDDISNELQIMENKTLTSVMMNVMPFGTNGVSRKRGSATNVAFRMSS